MNKNKDGLFYNYFDLACYLGLSIAYPVLTYIIQLKQTDYGQLQSVLSLMSVLLIFLWTFFYDFYTKYNDNGEVQNRIAVLILYFGRLIFGSFSIFVLVLFLGVILDFSLVEKIKLIFYCVPLFSIFPVSVSFIGFKKFYSEEPFNSQTLDEKVKSNKKYKIKINKAKKKTNPNLNKDTKKSSISNVEV